MTTKDITRFLHQPRKLYSAGRLQQGRSLLDSDFNEAALLADEDQRRGFADITGFRGSPDDGFRLGHWVASDSSDPPAPLQSGDAVAWRALGFAGSPAGLVQISLLPGTMYLGGMRFELERAENFGFQRDFLQATSADVGGIEGSALYYLNAWEQCVTAVEDGELRESALGGPDTTVRVRRMRRVERLALPADVTSCEQAFEHLAQKLEEGGHAELDRRTGELRSKARLCINFQARTSTERCSPDPPAQYVGTENQTLRVMLTAPDEYVWAIDNAAPLHRVMVGGLGTGKYGSVGPVTVELLTRPVDAEHEPQVNQIVEFLPFAAILEGAGESTVGPHSGRVAAEVGAFGKVRRYDATTNTIELETTVGIEEIRNLVYQWGGHFHPALPRQTQGGAPRPLFMRLWNVEAGYKTIGRKLNSDQGAVDSLGRMGVVPTFTGTGRPGDYWTIALRTDARDSAVPHQFLLGEGCPPHGPRHYYMPIARLEFTASATGGGDTGGPGTVVVRDCRPRLRKLSDPGCHRRIVGAGLSRFGGYETIQEAIDSLPLKGGTVSVRAGLYVEELSIEEREHVTVEGCGDDTVIRSPNTPSGMALIRIVDSRHVTLQNVQLQAIEQTAVLVRQQPGNETRHVRLSGLNVAAYVLQGGVPVPAPGSSNAALIDLDSVQECELMGLHIAAERRPGLAVHMCQGLFIEGVSVLGEDAESLPALPLVELDHLSDSRVRGVSVRAFGQLAMKLQHCFDTDLSQLDLMGGRSEPTETLMGVLEIDEGRDLRLERSRIVQAGEISDHAAVVIHGYGLTLTGNQIRSERSSVGFYLAWGGVQVRGGSERIVLRDNRIDGGLGHGITLGSVSWNLPDGSLPSRWEGVGRVQAHRNVTAAPPFAFTNGDVSPGFVENGSTFVASDEGPVKDVTLEANRIKQMGGNGISSFTVLGMAAPGADNIDTFVAQRLRIERNTIVNNLGQIVNVQVLHPELFELSSAYQARGLDVQALPYGGIVLGTLQRGATLRGNHIADNGIHMSDVPTSGIFVLHAEGLVVSSNRIENNGGSASTTLGRPLVPGIRAGIGVVFACPEAVQSSGLMDDILEVQAEPIVEATSLNRSTFALQVVDNSVQQPEGRALHAIAAGRVTIQGNFLSSSGFHGAPTVSDQYATGDVVFVLGLGGPWESLNADLVAGDDDFDDYVSITRARRILRNATNSPRLFVGAGGSVLFQDNQVTYDWSVKRRQETGFNVPLSFFPVVASSNDHLLATGNQLAFKLADLNPGDTPPPNQLQNEPVLAQALFMGTTVQVANNRIAEPVRASRISMVTSGDMLNATAFNQGTHPTFCYVWSGGPTQNLHDAGNQALFTHTSIVPDSAGRRDLEQNTRERLRLFLSLLRQA